MPYNSYYFTSAVSVLTLALRAVVAAAVGAVVVVTGNAASALFGAHESPLKTLNTQPVPLVETHVGYRLRVRIAHAVTCAQHILVSGYTVVVTPPIDIATGILIVAVDGIVCAITMQYLHPFLYVPAGMFINSVGTPLTVVTVTDVLIIKFGHSVLQFLLQLILHLAQQGGAKPPAIFVFLATATTAATIPITTSAEAEYRFIRRASYIRGLGARTERVNECTGLRILRQLRGQSGVLRL